MFGFLFASPWPADSIPPMDTLLNTKTYKKQCICRQRLDECRYQCPDCIQSVLEHGCRQPAGLAKDKKGIGPHPDPGRLQSIGRLHIAEGPRWQGKTLG